MPCTFMKYEPEKQQLLLLPKNTSQASASVLQSFDKESWSKMSDSEHAAEEKFWRTPELIERLLTFLDLDSTLKLARTHELTRNILQGVYNRNKLIQRTCPHNDAGDDLELQQRDVDNVKHLAATLKRLMDEPEAILLELLDLICHRFSLEDNPVTEGQDGLQMSCPGHPGGHFVSSHGFVLLEIVERAFGTTKQNVEDFKVRTLMEPMISVLSSRLSRQGVMPTGKSSVQHVIIRSTDDARSLKILQQCYPGWDDFLLTVEGDIGRDGWEALGVLETYESYVLPGLTPGWNCNNYCCQPYDSEDYEADEEEVSEEGDWEEEVAEEGAEFGEKEEESGDEEKDAEK